jgi:hypothetical protein
MQLSAVQHFAMEGRRHSGFRGGEGPEIRSVSQGRSRNVKAGGGGSAALFHFRSKIMIISERYEALRERATLFGDMFSLLLQREALLLRLKYSPDQPRIPAGQPGGGRWDRSVNAP